ncbi:Piwi domain-containing protein [Thamnocephalis sphaerospora]|uniref:Piwi domain-containing protein n=1 Tax=Thamnocephalis sphaerospora TaxID=78915 RepID=A0A4P9XNU4_9FUNG|nr:Piwi domain-containing protein [Thamnocephalis sphaerospora]|eukprot:RKP07663.1 Piwi domain-containing protein [Thamnocephalis sphaerospora]
MASGQYPSRPGYGRAGRPCKVLANHYLFTALPSQSISHYDIRIELKNPPKPDKREQPTLNRVVFKQLESLYRQQLGSARLAYDGKYNVYSSRPFAVGDALAVDVSSQPGQPAGKRQPREFRVTLRKVAEINMASIQAYFRGTMKSSEDLIRPTSAIEAVLRQVATEKFITIGSSFFTGEDARPIAGGLEAWFGYHMSVRAGERGMLLNIDTTVTAFYQEGSLLKLACESLDARNESDLARMLEHPKFRNRLQKILAGVRIYVTHRGKIQPRYVIAKIADGPASRQVFALGETGQRTNVAAYFQERYSVRLRFPNLPCVLNARGVAFPMEVCMVESHQRVGRQPNERAVADLIKLSATRPDRRCNITNGAHHKLQLAQDPIMRDFGLQVDRNMTQLNARVLNPPRIELGAADRSNAIVTPRDGSWSLKGQRLYSCPVLASWAVVAYADRRRLPENQIKYFLSTMTKLFVDMGMDVRAKNPPILYASQHQDTERALQSAAIAAKKTHGMPAQIVFNIFATRNHIYRSVKRIAETKMGLMTQCMLAKHTERPNLQYCSNIMLKVNKKLGGTSFKLARNMVPYVTSQPTIVIGADVSHPTGAADEGPSIAAMAGSLDANLSDWNLTYRTQEPQLEIIADMAEMVKEMLVNFRAKTNAVPRRILFYRDGVSDGQFDQVVREEVVAIKRACQELDVNYKPTLTFVVVKKRHHTRLYPTNPKDADRSGNCRAGTVVDSEITHPGMFDFFLQSQAGLQGTCKAGHYVVLYDEYHFKPDELQELTNNMCSMYARCSRSVGLVPAVYYAHLMADRARHYLSADEDASETASMLSSSTAHDYMPLSSALRCRLIVS